MVIHEFDRVMLNVSFWLAQDLIEDRLIGKIRVSMTKKGYSTIENDIHHSVTP